MKYYFYCSVDNVMRRKWRNEIGKYMKNFVIGIRGKK